MCGRLDRLGSWKGEGDTNRERASEQTVCLEVLSL